MTPNEYQKLAARTICPQGDVQLLRLGASETYCVTESLQALSNNTQILHASIGLSGEAGEIASQMQKWLYYGKPCDWVNIKEEIGDVLWYVAEMCEALNTTIEEVMIRNIEKLRLRYPEKYTDHNAAEENRDRAAERDILERQPGTLRSVEVTREVVEVTEGPLGRMDMDRRFIPTGMTEVFYAEPPTQNGQGWAEPPEEEEKPSVDPFELATRIAINYASGQNLDRALKEIERARSAQ